jgi:phosphatidylglycerol:prolipoprotein diacylglycerol transferase
MAPAGAYALAVTRAGCIVAGCCFGTVSHLPWAVRYPLGSLAANLHSTLGLLDHGATASLPVHPLPIYFALLALATGSFLLWRERQQTFAGELMLIFLALHEGGKFFLELLRAPSLNAQPGPLPLFSLGLALAAASTLGIVALTRGDRLRRLAA